jgi:Domain of unknown function (DUF6484)
MDAVKDLFEPLVVEEDADDFAVLSRKPAAAFPHASSGQSAATARLHGFDVNERPLLSGLLDLPGEVVAARTTIPLRRDQIGSNVVVLFDRGDVRRPIVLGVILDGQPSASEATTSLVSVNADDDRLVLSAEREIVLKCGDATITLTRAGKVLIKGTYVLSRSSGYNKIKGAAVDIN